MIPGIVIVRAVFVDAGWLHWLSPDDQWRWTRKGRRVLRGHMNAQGKIDWDACFRIAIAVSTGRLTEHGGVSCS